MDFFGLSMLGGAGEFRLGAPACIPIGTGAPISHAGMPLLLPGTSVNYKILEVSFHKF